MLHSSRKRLLICRLIAKLFATRFTTLAAHIRLQTKIRPMQTLAELLTSQGAQIEAGTTTFANQDARQAIALAAAQTTLVPLTHLGLIRVAGEDAAVFLHNLLTHEMKKWPEGTVRRAGFCTAKGRLFAHFMVWKQGADYLLQIPLALQEALQRKLSMYVLRSKVKLTDASSELACIGLANVADAQVLTAALQAAGLPVPEQNMKCATAEAAQVLRLENGRYMLCVPQANVADYWQKLTGAQAVPVGSDAWRWLDVQAGVPNVLPGTQEEFVPQMANYDLIDAVSFTKGCYPGQEIVARTQYLGKLKRRMFIAHLAQDNAPAAGTPLYSPATEDQACGAVVDATPAPQGGSDLLVVVQISSHDAGTVTVGQPDGPALQFANMPYAITQAESA